MTIQTRRFSGVLSGLACGLAMSPGALFAEELPWQRLPHVGAPMLSEAPTIDGRVDEREWVGASTLSPLISTESGQQYERDTEVYVGYTEEALYIAWRVHRDYAGPMHISADEPGRATTGVWGDDAIEVLIDVGRTGQEAVHFGGNAVGAYADGLVHADGRDAGAQWDWTYAARQTSTGWEAELRLPFSELDMDGPPEAGETWGLDVARADKTPEDTYAFWSYRDRVRFRNLAQVGVMQFVGERPAFRLREIGRLGDMSSGALAELVHLGSDDVSVNVQHAVYLLEESGAVDNVFDTIDSGVGEEDMVGDVGAYTTLDRQIAQVLGFYTVKGENERTVDAVAGGRTGLNLSAVDVPAGDVLIAYHVTDAEGHVLGSALVPTVQREPIFLSVVPYFLSSEKLDLSVSLHSDQLRGRVHEAEVMLTQDGQTLEEGRYPIDEAMEQVLFSSEGIAEGGYELMVRLLDANGEVAGELLETLYRPVPDWVKNQPGTSAFVPPPYEPVEAAADYARIWGREYRFDGSFLPSQMVSQEEGLFAAAPRLHLKLDGEKVELRGTLSLTETDDEFARYEFEGSAGDVAVRAVTKVEFDGFTTIDLELDTQGVRVDELFVEFPIKDEHAELYTFNAFFNENTHRPDTRQMEELSAGLSRAGLIDDGFTIGFNHAIWLGTPERGFQWCAETAQHWHNQQRAEAIEVIRTGEADQTLFRLRVIDKPTEVDALAYRWGLMAGPVRPYGRGAQDFYFGQLHTPYETLELDEQSMDFRRFIPAYREAGGQWLNVFSRWNRPHFGQPFREAEGIEQRRALNDRIQAEGFRTTWYAGWNALDPSMELYQHYGVAMRRVPTRFSWGGYKECTNAGYIEYLAGGAVWMIENIGMDGIYLDSTPGPEFCNNPLHSGPLGGGCGYVDPETGERIVTRDIWGRRELFKRLFKIFHGEVVENGLVYGHDGWAPLMGINSFIDVFHTAEGARREDYHDIDFYRAQYNPTQYGVPVEHAWERHHPVDRNMAWAVSLVHDNRIKMYPYYIAIAERKRDTYEPDLGIDHRMWVASQWFDWDADWKWHPYYSNEEVLSVEADEVYASFHANDQGQIIFNVVNMAEQASNAQFQLDLEALGLPSQLYARDVVTHETFEIHDGQFELEVLGYRPRVLMINATPVPEL
ncbi:hypothetical protein ACERK3_17525 [Phycisphaerales bacterium AB-hyl4]|uniref:Carbohydrate binding protein with CBM9 domain n=1 Tax=Natronomicrosphaera hydrolytica TaxID=3242702 RepID=A0ABV4UAJ6_9BACT